MWQEFFEPRGVAEDVASNAKLVDYASSWHSRYSALLRDTFWATVKNPLIFSAKYLECQLDAESTIFHGHIRERKNVKLKLYTSSGSRRIHFFFLGRSTSRDIAQLVLDIYLEDTRLIEVL